MGAVAKSYMMKGFLIYEEMRKNLVIYEDEEAVSHTVYDFATATFWISLYKRKILFLFYQCIESKFNTWAGVKHQQDG
jgi:hypothetical protein